MHCVSGTFLICQSESLNPPSNAICVSGVQKYFRPFNTHRILRFDFFDLEQDGVASFVVERVGAIVGRFVQGRFVAKAVRIVVNAPTAAGHRATGLLRQAESATLALRRFYLATFDSVRLGFLLRRRGGVTLSVVRVEAAARIFALFHSVRFVRPENGARSSVIRMNALAPLPRAMFPLNQMNAIISRDFRIFKKVQKNFQKNFQKIFQKNFQKNFQKIFKKIFKKFSKIFSKKIFKKFSNKFKVQ